MIFACPSCRQAYTLGQCHIPATAGTRATVTCVCKKHLEVYVVDIPDTSWKRHFRSRQAVLGVEVKLRG